MSGRDLLLDYAFPIEANEALADPSTAYLKRVLVVAKPKTGQEGNVGTIYQCLNMAAVAARTDNDNAQELFDAGLTQCYVLLADDLDMVTPLENFKSAFTLLVSDDFDKDDMILAQASGTITVTDYADLISGTDDSITLNGVTFTAQTGAVTEGEATFQAATSNDATAASLAAQINAHDDTKDDVIATVVGAVITVKAKDSGTAGNDIGLTYTDNDTNVGITLAGLTANKLSGGAGILVGSWNGVIGVSESDLDFLEDQAVITKRTAFFGSDTNGATNMFSAFGQFLAARDWKNQQYVEMPADDEIDELGEAKNLYDLRVSFVLTSEQYGNKLAFFTNNRKAIVAPYISELFQISLQGWGVAYIAANQPAYTVKEASLLQDELKEKADKAFKDTGLIEDLTVKISLVNSNFTANGDLTMKEPKALWRVAAVLTETE
jgi:hypothetical protein